MSPSSELVIASCRPASWDEAKFDPQFEYLCRAGDALLELDFAEIEVSWVRCRTQLRLTRWVGERGSTGRSLSDADAGRGITCHHIDTVAAHLVAELGSRDVAPT